jgi:nucleotide sugar dehydrogenase
METNPTADVEVASNPEFLREGAAIRDFKFPDRIVVGTSHKRARKILDDIYRPLSLNKAPMMFTARRTAELIKYAANAFLATKITFINEIADLAEKVGADVQEVARGIGLDNRIGTKFLHAGPGFGGSSLSAYDMKNSKRIENVNMNFRSLTSAQIRAARSLIRWSAEDLARQSALSVATIRRAELMEEQTSMTTANDIAVRRTLEAAGVEFIDENGGGPGVRLRKPLKAKSGK